MIEYMIDNDDGANEYKIWDTSLKYIGWKQW